MPEGAPKMEDGQQEVILPEGLSSVDRQESETPEASENLVEASPEKNKTEDKSGLAAMVKERTKKFSLEAGTKLIGSPTARGLIMIAGVFALLYLGHIAGDQLCQALPGGPGFESFTGGDLGDFAHAPHNITDHAAVVTDSGVDQNLTIDKKIFDDRIYNPGNHVAIVDAPVPPPNHHGDQIVIPGQDNTVDFGHKILDKPFDSGTLNPIDMDFKHEHGSGLDQGVQNSVKPSNMNEKVINFNVDGDAVKQPPTSTDSGIREKSLRFEEAGGDAANPTTNPDNGVNGASSDAAKRTSGNNIENAIKDKFTSDKVAKGGSLDAAKRTGGNIWNVIRNKF